MSERHVRNAWGAPRLERLREALCDLDVEPAEVRADPSGSAWLPAELKAWCDDDPACREELEEFVAAELALLRLSASEPADPFFTARVVRALPRRFMGSRLSPRRRAIVLAGAYAAAGAAAWAVVSRVAPEGRGERWLGAVDQAHAWLDTGVRAPGPASPYIWAAVVAVALVALALFGGGRTHTPAG